MKTASVTMKELASGRTDLWKIDPRGIGVVDGFNVRRDYGDLKELMDSILASGVENLTPLLLRREGAFLYLIRGHRRLRAVLMAIEAGHDIPFVPCQMAGQTFDPLRQTCDLLHSNEGKPLTFPEIAEVVHRLKDDFGLDPAAIAKETGKTAPAIRNYLLYLEAPEAVRKAVEKGKISGSTVVRLTREVDGDADALAQKVKEAIQTAADAGKDHASPKHVPASAEPEPPRQPIPEPSNKTDWSQVNGNAAPGEPRLSHDTTKNLENLNKAIERLADKPHDADGFTLAEAIIDYLEGNRPLKGVIDLIRR